MQIVAGRAGGTPIPKRKAVPLGIWIHQNLFGIKTLAVPGLSRAVDAVGLTHARLPPLNEGMPNVEASIVGAI